MIKHFKIYNDFLKTFKYKFYQDNDSRARDLRWEARFQGDLSPSKRMLFQNKYMLFKNKLS